jgi:hypothetical protein
MMKYRKHNDVPPPPAKYFFIMFSLSKIISVTNECLPIAVTEIHDWNKFFSFRTTIGHYVTNVSHFNQIGTRLCGRIVALTSCVPRLMIQMYATSVGC